MMKTHKVLTIFSLTAILINPLNGKTYVSVPLKDWQFESYYVQYNDNWTATLVKEDVSIADHLYSSHPLNAVINGHMENGRAELSSPAFTLKPFSWYEIDVQYQTGVTDNVSTTLAGLYPATSRDLMDQIILPSTNGSVKTQHALLHTGASGDEIHFFLGHSGIGQSIFYSFRFREVYSYQKPEERLLVVDLLKFKPNPENLALWKSVKKFTRLFGFVDQEYIHPLKASTKRIEETDPGFIIFTPTATDTEGIRMGFLKKRRFDKGIKRIIRYAEENSIPVLGICAGHQAIAQHYGAFLARLKNDDTGEYLKEIGPTILNIVKDDPIFNHLPEKNKLKIIEAHMVVVGYNFDIPENLAASTDFGNQIFRYQHPKGVPWYTFQGHVEKDWEYACPEGSVVMNNILSLWGLIPDRFEIQETLTQGF